MAKPNITTKTIGDKEIIDALKRLDKAMVDSLEPVVHAGAAPVTEEAKRRAPKRTHNLADQIKQETLEKSDKAVEVGVGPDDKEAFYALFVELGTDPHFIYKDQARALQMERGGFATEADHPGTEAQPFLRPALDGNEEAIMDAIAEELKKELGL